MIFVLAFLVRSDYVEITTDNVDSLIGGSRPVLVKFYIQGCPFCQGMAIDFEDAALAFDPDVPFGGIDCEAQPSLCTSFNVSGYPVVHLYLAGTRDPITYNVTRSFDGFCDFVENHTEFRARRSPNKLLDITPLNFVKLIAERSCVLASFSTPFCAHSKRWLPHLRLAANSFAGEPTIAVGVVNCEQDADLCAEYGVKLFPTVWLFEHGRKVPYVGGRNAMEAVAFLNEKCGTRRAVGGLLDDTVGVIEEAGPLVASFVANPSNGIIEKMREVEGAEFYVRAMERYRDGGPEQIRKDIAIIEEALEDRRGSWASLDGMKKRLNVLTQFVSKPKPTRRATRTAAAADGAAMSVVADKDL
jgi:protein disulfide-isomerase A6